MTDYKDLIARLRSMYGHGDIQFNELINRRTGPEAADVMAALVVRVAELEAENASIRDLLSKKVVDSTMLSSLSIQDSAFNASFEGGAAGLLVDSFVEQFRDSGATNFVELHFADNELGEFVVTMQRKDGDTPGQQKAKAEARVAELEAERAEREKQKPAAFIDDDECFQGPCRHATAFVPMPRGTPLYAAPPVAAPVRLTDSEADAVARIHGTGGWQTLADMMKFSRAVETAVLRANGFKVEE